MQPICRSQLVYFQIPAAGGTAGSSLPFPEQPSLAGCKITGFRTYTAAQVAFAPDRIAVLPVASALNITVNLNESIDQRFQDMPFNSLVAELNAGVWRECVPFVVDWQKSSWRFNGAATASTDLLLEVFYVRPEDAPELFPEVYRFDAGAGTYIRK